MPTDAASPFDMTQLDRREPPGAQQHINALTAAFFSCFDNRDGRQPDLATLVGHFTEQAVIARSAGADIQIFSPMEFAIPRIGLLTSGALVDFHEAETSSTTTIFGNLAIRTSRYRKSGTLDGAAYGGSGTKCFQFVAIKTGWRILSLAWIDDEP